MPRMISTSFISGTGFMKCRPMNRSGRSVAEARRVIEIDEVFEASRVSGFRCGCRLRKIDFLTSSFSVAASMARSVAPIASRPFGRRDARQGAAWRRRR
jgi:hypothetical protein